MEFGSGGRWENGGVIVFETGRAFGGDNRYYYVGEFGTVADRIEATVRVVHYHGEPKTAYGDTATDYEIKLEGKQSRNRVEGHISREGFDRMEARLTWRCDLPTGVA
jgi:hypothetical protein